MPDYIEGEITTIDQRRAINLERRNSQLEQAIAELRALHAAMLARGENIDTRSPGRWLTRLQWCRDEIAKIIAQAQAEEAR